MFVRIQLSNGADGICSRSVSVRSYTRPLVRQTSTLHYWVTTPGSWQSICGISDGFAAFLVGDKPRGLNSGRGEKTALVRIFVTWFIAIQFSRFDVHLGVTILDLPFGCFPLAYLYTTKILRCCQGVGRIFLIKSNFACKLRVFAIKLRGS